MVNVFLHTFKLFTWDLLLSIAYWPLWWYSKGLVSFARFFNRQIRQSFHQQALDILFSNWFKPMYAQYDWQGRIISFVFRTLMILWRLLFWLVWLVGLLLLAVLYLLAWPLALFLTLKIIFTVSANGLQ
jgi:hypothetical protein